MRKLSKIILYPEFGAIFSAIIIFIICISFSNTFYQLASVANWLDPASLLGIMVVPIALLMIGGEVDLSAGVATTTSGIIFLLLYNSGINYLISLFLSLLFLILIGLINGLLVVFTKLSSFIITLAMFLILQGINSGIPVETVNNAIVTMNNKIDNTVFYHIINGSILIFNTSFPIYILWWILYTLFMGLLLNITRIGNWIFAIGGNIHIAYRAGIPVRYIKVMLFIVVQITAWFVGIIYAVKQGSVQSNSGIGQELNYIVAAVIGGCVMTGGIGSIVGASLGALIYGMISNGIVYIGISAEWSKLFLGLFLLVAVLINKLSKHFNRLLN